MQLKLSLLRDLLSGDIPQRPHHIPRPQHPHLWTWTYMADSIHNLDRYNADLEYFNQLFKNQCSYDLSIENWCHQPLNQPPASPITVHPLKITTTADKINIKSSRAILTDYPDIKRIYDAGVKANQNLVFDPQQPDYGFPITSIIILYLDGDKFPGGAKGVAVPSTEPNRLPYVILLAKNASSTVYAHEIGHVLNHSNKNGNKDDPDFIKADPATGVEEDRAHNRNPDNIMHPITGTKLTAEQCTKFRESVLIYRP